MSVSEIWLIVAIVTGIIGIIGMCCDSPVAFLLVVTVIASMISHQYSESTQKADAEREARAIYWQTPHVLKQSPDGCKVYAYTIGGDWHYFTRCQNTNSVQDETPRKVSCGKNCTKTVYDVSQTQ